MSAVLAFIFMSVGVVKVLDIVISGTALALWKPTSRRPIDWTPVYSLASHLRAAHPRGRIVFRLAFDVVFRAPVLSFIQAVAVLVCLGGVQGGAASADTDTAHVLWLITAATAVAVAAGSVAYALVGSLTAHGWSQVATASGHSLSRTGETRVAIDPALTILSLSGALFTSFAALYLATAHLAPDAISHPGSVFTPVDALYFSVITAATVGYGDMRPTAELGRLLVCSEVLMTGTVIGLLVTVLGGIAAEARNRAGHTP